MRGYKIRLYLGSDHTGFKLREEIKKYLFFVM